MNKPEYRSNKFWQEVSAIIGEPVHCLEFHANTFSNSGDEWGARVRVLYGETGECLLQMTDENTAKATAEVILKGIDG